MEDEVRQRILQILDTKGVTISAFAKRNGENQSKMNKQIKHSTTISIHTILLLLNQFPNISAEWLLRGTGEMYITEHPSHEVRLSRLEQVVNEIINKSHK